MYVFVCFDSLSVGEGLNTNINKIGGIFQGALTPPLPLVKINKKCVQLFKMSSIGSLCFETSFL